MVVFEGGKPSQSFPALTGYTGTHVRKIEEGETINEVVYAISSVERDYIIR
jgi:hypothetical protein